MSQYPEAEEFLKEALAVRRACLPTAHPLVAQCERSTSVFSLEFAFNLVCCNEGLRLLGQLYNDWEKYDLAEKLLAVAWSMICASSSTTNEEAAIGRVAVYICTLPLSSCSSLSLLPVTRIRRLYQPVPPHICLFICQCMSVCLAGCLFLH